MNIQTDLVKEISEIAVDEAQWDAQFAGTEDNKLAKLIASIEAEIKEGKTTSMFDEHGEFIKRT